MKRLSLRTLFECPKVANRGRFGGLECLLNKSARGLYLPPKYTQAMIKSYLKIALRNLRRHPSYTFINMTGLVVGMTCCMLIILFVRDELSFDQHHENADRIYRIVSDWGEFSTPATNPPFINRFAAEYPDIKMGLLQPFEALVRSELSNFSEDRLFFANPDIFQVFDIPIVRGNPDVLLTEPGTVILTQEMAEKYFGNADPIDRVLVIDNQFELTVSGIVESMPSQSHFHFDFLVPWVTLDFLMDFSNSTSWGNNSYYTYLLLPDGYLAASLEAQLPAFIEQQAGENWNGSELSLQALTDIHLHSRHNNELEANSNIAYIYIFSAIAVFILLIACVNFMNLATARSEERSKEVGIRKVVGARRTQLVNQFLTESILLAGCALLLSVILTRAVLPAFEALSEKTIAFDLFASGGVILAFLGVALFVGIFSGSYPAFVLSAFRPIGILKSGKVGRKTTLRKGLVLFQFVISVCLIIGTLVVYNQLDFLRKAHLGFDKEQVITASLGGLDDAFEYGVMKDALLQRSDVSEVSISSEGLPSELLNGSTLQLEGAVADDPENNIRVRSVSMGHDFFQSLGVEMLHGRNLSMDFPSDSSAYILNATAARLLSQRYSNQNISVEDLLGRTLQRGQNSGPIVGIVNDFNMSSLHEEIEPIVFFILPRWYDHLLIRIQPGNLAGTLAGISTVWESMYPQWSFEYQFADQGFYEQYRAEERLGRIFSIFAILAIFIACMGLFGLASFTVHQRTKEFGVRKVLGASIGNMVLLITREFAQIVLLAICVASPLAYLGMNRWLQDFAYTIELSWWMFAVAGILALLIAALTICYHSLKLATKNPIESLRYE